MYYYPHAKVIQPGYDIPCEGIICTHSIDKAFAGDYCGRNITCMNSMLSWWQGIHHATLRAKYPARTYTALSFLGTAQKVSQLSIVSTSLRCMTVIHPWEASGVKGADVGKARPHSRVQMLVGDTLRAPHLRDPCCHGLGECLLG